MNKVMVIHSMCQFNLIDHIIINITTGLNIILSLIFILFLVIMSPVWIPLYIIGRIINTKD